MHNADMRIALLAALLIILAQSASADVFREELFNEKITSSGVYQGSNGDNFTIELGGNKISVELPSRTMLVDNNTCETSELYEVCLDISEFSHYNNTQPERVVNKRAIKISVLLAAINVSREFDNEQVWVGQEIEVRTRLKNVGHRPTKVFFTDKYSDFFEVSLPPKCDLKNDVVSWKGSLNKNQVMECVYKIKALKASTFNSAATVTYFNGVKDETRSSQTTLTIDEPR